MNEIPKPVLGQQPPMPGTNLVPVNLVQGEENLLEQTMMPTTLYGEGSNMSQWINPQDQPLAPQEYHPDLDIETLLYIARNNTRGPRQNPQGERGCYNCGALDHWQKECPREKQPQFKPAPRYCEECMVTHLPIHCPKNPHNIPQPGPDLGKTNLNIVGIIPSGTEDEAVVPLQVITRAQAKELPEPIMEENIELAPTKKRKQKSWRERRAKMAAKKRKEIEQKQKEKNKKAEDSSSSNTSKHEGGSVLVDKLFEPLDTLLMAYESRLKSGETLETQWENYPDPELEKRRFAICQRLVEVTQALIEQNKNETKETKEKTSEPELSKHNQHETDPGNNHTIHAGMGHQE